MEVVLPRSSLFRIRQRSLVRGTLLSLCAFALSLGMAGFPHIDSLHGSRWQWLLVPAVGWAMVEKARCLRSQWSFYHAGVLILLYSDLMILALVLFLALY
jgi:hypothetical protein